MYERQAGKSYIDLHVDYSVSVNPVTRASIRDIISNRQARRDPEFLWTLRPANAKTMMQLTQKAFDALFDAVPRGVLCNGCPYLKRDRMQNKARCELFSESAPAWFGGVIDGDVKSCGIKEL